jgi:hypothetical protein
LPSGFWLTDSHNSIPEGPVQQFLLDLLLKLLPS